MYSIKTPKNAPPLIKRDKIIFFILKYFINIKTPVIIIPRKKGDIKFFNRFTKLSSKEYLVTR